MKRVFFPFLKSWLENVSFLTISCWLAHKLWLAALIRQKQLIPLVEWNCHLWTTNYAKWTKNKTRMKMYNKHKTLVEHKMFSITLIVLLISFNFFVFVNLTKKVLFSTFLNFKVTRKFLKLFIRILLYTNLISTCIKSTIFHCWHVQWHAHFDM